MEPARTQRRFTLSEKIAIVRESLAPGVSATHVARRHRIAVNVFYYWRKAYREVVDTDLTKVEGGAAIEKEVADRGCGRWRAAGRPGARSACAQLLLIVPPLAEPFPQQRDLERALPEQPFEVAHLQPTFPVNE